MEEHKLLHWWVYAYSEEGLLVQAVPHTAADALAVGIGAVVVEAVVVQVALPFLAYIGPRAHAPFPD